MYLAHFKAPFPFHFVAHFLADHLSRVQFSARNETRVSLKFLLEDELVFRVELFAASGLWRPLLRWLLCRLKLLWMVLKQRGRLGRVERLTRRRVQLWMPRKRRLRTLLQVVC